VLAWITFACSIGYGGPVDAFLSWKAWMPLSRLTYCAYLMHPVLMITYYRSRQDTLHFGTHIQMIGLFFGFATLSYAIAYAASLAFEIPISHLETIGKSTAARRTNTLNARDDSQTAVKQTLEANSAEE